MKNKIIDTILDKSPLERLNFEVLTLFAWCLENCRRDSKRSLELEKLFNKWRDKEIEEIANFDVETLPSKNLPQ